VVLNPRAARTPLRAAKRTVWTEFDISYVMCKTHYPRWQLSCRDVHRIVSGYKSPGSASISGFESDLKCLCISHAIVLLKHNISILDLCRIGRRKLGTYRNNTRSDLIFLDWIGAGSRERHTRTPVLSWYRKGRPIMFRNEIRKLQHPESTAGERLVDGNN